MRNSFLEIWAINLVKYWNNENILLGFLDQNEQQQAFRFKFDYLRKNYVVSHAILRYLIAQYLKIYPKDILFSYGPFGKPFIQDKAFYFNMSHAHNMALYAFSQNREVGVDIEYMHHDISIECLPLSVFPYDIQVEIKSFPLNKQKECFYRKWVQMEAYLKAVGVGLHSDFHQLEMPSCFQQAVYEIDLPEEYIGAVTYKPPFCLANTSLEHPAPKIKAAINIEIPPRIIGIL